MTEDGPESEERKTDRAYVETGDMTHGEYVKKWGKYSEVQS